jgi:hypothetical protein
LGWIGLDGKGGGGVVGMNGSENGGGIIKAEREKRERVDKTSRRAGACTIIPWVVVYLGTGTGFLHFSCRNIFGMQRSAPLVLCTQRISLRTLQASQHRIDIRRQYPLSRTKISITVSSTCIYDYIYTLKKYV